MSEVTNGDIYNLLVNIKGDLGRVEGVVKGLGDNLLAHVADDKINLAAMTESVQKLQLSGARQKGFIAAISTVGAIVGAGIGAAADYFSRGH
jgi:hypothetical protein